MSADLDALHAKENEIARLEAELLIAKRTIDKLVCPRCNGSEWLDPIGPKSDGSYSQAKMVMSAILHEEGRNG